MTNRIPTFQEWCNNPTEYKEGSEQLSQITIELVLFSSVVENVHPLLNRQDGRVPVRHFRNSFQHPIIKRYLRPQF